LELPRLFWGLIEFANGFDSEGGEFSELKIRAKALGILALLEISNLSAIRHSNPRMINITPIAKKKDRHILGFQKRQHVRRDPSHTHIIQLNRPCDPTENRIQNRAMKFDTIVLIPSPEI
jgi:hypothetical protein